MTVLAPLTERVVWDYVYRPDGTIWPGFMAKIAVDPSAYRADGSVPALVHTITTDSEGRWELDLFCGIPYVLTEIATTGREVPPRVEYRFTVPDGSTPIPMAHIRPAGAGVDATGGFGRGAFGET